MADRPEAHQRALDTLRRLSEPWGYTGIVERNGARWAAERARLEADELELLEEARAASIPPAGTVRTEPAAIATAELGGAASPLLESKGLSDPQPKKPRAVVLGPTSDAWMAAIELETAPWRSARAREHATTAARALADAGQPGRHNRAAWHKGRARGALERFGRVADCGKDGLTATCIGSCGLIRTAPVGCSCARLCTRCRSTAAHERQARFGDARVRALTVASRLGLLRQRRTGGAWSEKLLTLTVPHVQWSDAWARDFILEVTAEHTRRGGGDEAIEVVLRLELLHRAWRVFTVKWLQPWARKVRRLCKGRVRWYRALEVTPGADLFGHPHFHVWMLSPFVDRDALQDAWNLAVATVVGAPFPGGDVVLDIKQIRQRPEEIRRELLKGRGHALRFGRAGEDVIAYADGWTIVDVAGGDRISPAAAARIYESLERRRMVQASKELLAPPLHVCPACSAEGSTVVHLEKGRHDPHFQAWTSSPTRAPPPRE